MPHAQKPSNDPRDRILDYLTEALEVTDDGIAIIEGHLQGRAITVADRPKLVRDGQRRFFLRIGTPGNDNKVERTRVLSTEESVVALLDALDKQVPIARKPRGVAARKQRQEEAPKPKRTVRDARTGLTRRG